MFLLVVTTTTMMMMITVKEVMANPPDKAVKGKLERICLLIDMSAPHRKKHLSGKTSSATIKIMKTEMMQVVIGALGLVKKGMGRCTQAKKSLGTSIEELQKRNCSHNKKDPVHQVIHNSFMTASSS